MKKEILFLTMVLLLLIPPSLAVLRDPRMLADVSFDITNDTNNYVRWIHTNGTETYIAIQLIPKPNATCFSSNGYCDPTLWDTNITLRAVRNSRFLGTWFVGGLGGKDNNFTVDVLKCWNWWNDTDEEKREFNRLNCPKIVMEVERWDRGVTLVAYWTKGDPSPSGKPYPNIELLFKGFSLTRRDVDETLNRNIKTFITSSSGFVSLTLDVWNILYYIFVIIAILIGIAMVLVVLPSSIKWIIRKVTE